MDDENNNINSNEIPVGNSSNLNEISDNQQILSETSESINTLHTNVVNKTNEIDKSIGDVKKDIEHVYNELDIHQNDIKKLQIDVDSLKISTGKTQQTVNDIVEKIKIISQKQTETTKHTDDVTKNNSKLAKSNEVEPISNNDYVTKSELNKLLSTILLRVNQSQLSAKKQSTFKTNSTIGKKATPVTIQSFSELANTQLINNLKQVLKIKKREDETVRKSGLIKLAVLACVGYFAYILSQMQNVRDAFKTQVDAFNENLELLKQGKITLADLFKEGITSFVVAMIDAVWSGIKTSVINQIKSGWDSFKEWLGITKTPENSYDIYKQTTQINDAINQLTNQSKSLNVDTWLKNINSFIGEKLFGLKQLPDVPDVTDDTGDTQPFTSPVTLNNYNNNNDTNNVSSPTNFSIFTPNIFNPTENYTPPTNNLNVNNNFNSNDIHQNSLNLKNGKNIILNDNDDIYIANKPDGIIHKIFTEISNNYTSVQNIFEKDFNSIIDSLNKQTSQIYTLINYNKHKSSIDPQLIKTLNNRYISNTTSSNNSNIIFTPNGVNNVRGDFRQIINQHG